MRLVAYLMITVFLSIFAYGQSGESAEVKKLKRQIKQYQERELTLNAALTASRKREFKARQESKQLAMQLQALGLHEGDAEQRLLQAVADAQALNKRLTALQNASEKVLFNFGEFLRQNKQIELEQKKKLLATLKGLDKAIVGELPGFEEPKEEGVANLHDAKILSIDSKSGMLVFNIGEKATVKIGMTFTIKRGNRVLGEAMIAEVRPNLSGALVTSLANKEDPIRVGDAAVLKLRR